MSSAASYGVYKQVNVETASQGKLIVMLFNGAIQRAEEAKRCIEAKDLRGAHERLIKAQDIIAELRSALNMSVGEVAHNLDRIYEYFFHLLVQANVRKDIVPLEECVSLMTNVRDTWEEVFEIVDKEDTPKPPAAYDPHGASMMNLQG